MAQIRVLLVDDGPRSSEGLVEALTEEGGDFEVTRVPDPESAGPIEEGAVDCVIVTGRGGESMVPIETIRDTDPTVPIVLYPETGDEGLATAAITAGVSGYVRQDAHADPESVLADRVRNQVARQRREHRRHRAQERAEEYFELAGAIMVALDPDGRIDRVNDRAATVLGADPAELIGRDWFEIALPEDEQEAAQEAFAGLLEGRLGEYEEVRTEVLTRTGARRMIEWRNNVLRDESGEVIGTLSAGRDVTEQEAHARAIEAERDRFLALFENIPEPAIVSSFEANEPIVTQVNRSFEQVFGFDAEAVVGENIDSFIVPPSEDDAAEAFNDELVEGNPVQAEVTRLTATGPRDFRLHVVPLKPGTENVEGYAIYEDITAIKDRQRVLEGLHAAATDIVSATSAATACERTVEAAADILRFDLCEISLEDEGKLVPVASSEGIDDDVSTAVSVEEGLAGKTYRTGTSEVVPDLQAVEEAKPQGPWSSALSVPIGTHGIFQAAAVDHDAFDESDLELAELLISHTAETLTRIETESALRDREETLREQNERLERFTSVLSHDLRNPLNVASGELDLARQDRDGPHLGKVARAQTRMRELVEDVLTLARSDRPVTDPEVIDLEETLEDCFGNVDTGNATLRVETDRVVVGEPGRLHSMFENLFRNAVEHGGPDVDITVGDLPDGFYIEDDGTGIPDEKRQTVLEAGFSTGEHGTGLGLTIVAEAVEAHGWTMTIAASEHGGARFEFTGVETVEQPASYGDD